MDKAITAIFLTLYPLQILWIIGHLRDESLWCIRQVLLIQPKYFIREASMLLETLGRVLRLGAPNTIIQVLDCYAMVLVFDPLIGWSVLDLKVKDRLLFNPVLVVNHRGHGLRRLDFLQVLVVE